VPGTYRIMYSDDLPSSLDIPRLAAGSLPIAPSGVTPTSHGLIEPLGWASPVPAG
jgi:hypothetical protein